MFLGMLLRGKEASGSGRLRSTHDFLHGFSTLGTIFVAALVVSGIVHYGDLTAWSFSALFQSTYGKFLLFKLALFGEMLGLGAGSEEHTSERQSLTRKSYAAFCCEIQTTHDE